MPIDETVEDFLSHHGVKGQKWGVRHPVSFNRVHRVAAGTQTRKLKSQSSKEIRKKRILAGVVIGGALATTAIVSSILTRKGMTPINVLKSSSGISNLKYKAQAKAVDTGAGVLKNILAKNATRPMSSISKAVNSPLPKHSSRWKAHEMKDMRKNLANIQWKFK